MLAISASLGIYGALKGGPQNTIRQLLAADGQLNPFLVSTSLMASFISSSFILGKKTSESIHDLASVAAGRSLNDSSSTGNAAEIHQHGTMFLYTLASYLLVIPVTAHLFLPLFYNSGAMTVFEVRS